MNRSHFDRPLQGNGRDSHGYGHTDLTHDDRPWHIRYAWPMIGVALILFWLGVGLAIEPYLP